MNPVVPNPIAMVTERVHAAVVAGIGDHAPQTKQIANSAYTSPTVADAELRTSFAAPLLVAPSGALQKPGDFIAFDLVDTPIIVSRGSDGIARVFLNACRHRGARVADGSGCTRRFTCPYHNWVYSSDGELVGIPGREGFTDLNESDHGLLGLPSEERHGFIWALRDPDGFLDLDTHLGPLGAELDSWEVSYEVAATMELPISSNWKCALEAFQETYHFPYVHGSSIVGQGTIPNISVFDSFGRHHRLGVPLSSMAGCETPPDGENVSLIYYIHPCTVIATSPIGGELLQFFPGDDPLHCKVRHSVLSRQHLDEETSLFFEAYTPLIQAVVRDEDAVVLESCGIGLSAGRTSVVLGRNEIGCQAAHEQIEHDLASLELQ